MEIEYGWGTNNLAAMKSCPKGFDPEIFSIVQACRQVILSKGAPKPTEHRSIIFELANPYAQPVFIGTKGQRGQLYPATKRRHDWNAKNDDPINSHEYVTLNRLFLQCLLDSAKYLETMIDQGRINYPQPMDQQTIMGLKASIRLGTAVLNETYARE